MKRTATNNPVIIVSCSISGRYSVQNEGGDEIYNAANRSSCYVWCRKHNCQPVKSFETMELEDRWSILHWFNITSYNLKAFSGAEVVLRDRSGALTLALWDHSHCKGWVLYRRKNPRSIAHTVVAHGGSDSVHWKNNEAIHWAESLMWIGMEEPQKQDLELWLDYQARTAMLKESGFKKF